MAVQVTYPSRDDWGLGQDVYNEGRKWHIDESGYLHVVGRDGNIASYDRDNWINVAQAPRVDS